MPTTSIPDLMASSAPSVCTSKSVNVRSRNHLDVGLRYESDSDLRGWHLRDFGDHLTHSLARTRLDVLNEADQDGPPVARAITAAARGYNGCVQRDPQHAREVAKALTTAYGRKTTVPKEDWAQELVISP